MNDNNFIQPDVLMPPGIMSILNKEYRHSCLYSSAEGVIECTKKVYNNYYSFFVFVKCGYYVDGFGRFMYTNTCYSIYDYIENKLYYFDPSIPEQLEEAEKMITNFKEKYDYHPITV